MNNSMLIKLKRKLKKKPNGKVLVIFKGRHPFLTDLDKLDLSNCVSLLIMNAYYAKITSKDHLARFDFACWFDGGDYWKGDSLARLDSLWFPEVEEIVCKLVQSLPSVERLRLVAMEESFVRFAAVLREKWNIPGPKTVDTEPFTSKVRMKILARTQKIPVPRFQIISPAGLLTSEENLHSLEEYVGYPMVLKPAHGVGGAGVHKMFSREELLNWLENHGSGYAAYLVEEYVEGTEYNVFALVQKHSVQFFPVTLSVRRSTVLRSLRTGCPMAVSSAVDTPEINKQAIEFGQQILDALNPNSYSLIMIQMFLTTNLQQQNQENIEFKFSKVAYRVPDAVVCVALQNNSGISPETVHIMASVRRIHLKDYSTPERHFAAVIYPFRPGVFKSSHPSTDLSSYKTELASESEVITCVNEGQQLDSAKNAGDVVLKIYLRHPDHEKLLNDINFLCDNFAPLIVQK